MLIGTTACSNGNLADNVTEEEWNHRTIWRIVERQNPDQRVLETFVTQNAGSTDPNTAAYVGLIKTYMADPFYDPDGGFALLRQACGAGHARACRSSMRPMLRQAESLEDGAWAASELQGSCRAGVGLACGDLATFYSGEGLREADPELAKTFTDLSCQTPDEAHCATSVFALRHVDLEQSRSQLSDLCDRDQPATCHLHIRTLSDPGFEIEDVDLVLELLDENCRRRYNGSCVRLTYMIFHVDPPNGRYLESEKISQELCYEGYVGNCVNLTQYYASAKAEDLELAVEMNKMACELGDQNFCYWLAERYAEGQGLPVNPAKARMLYKQLCDDNFRRSCEKFVALGRTYESMTKEQVDSAVCQQGDLQYCRVMAWNHAMGDGVPKNTSKARQLFESSCEQGLGMSCLDLGSLHDYAMHGFAEDKAKAKALYRKGCDLGETIACAQITG